MRNLNTKISIFNLNGYIESNKKIIKLIDQKLKEKGLSIRELSRNTSISHTVIIDFLKGSSMKIKNLEKIIRFIKIDNIYIEKLNPLLHSSPYKFRKYNLKFPLKLNPLNIRVVAHFLGDSSLEARGCRWYQKSEIGGDYMVRLIKKLSGITIKKGTKDSYGIPTILGDIVCYALNLQRI
ncbi:MAG: helix-turn-helix transcriptional regulator, partial [Nanoarchaeota archaeon]|nr:helix-turn-helix transcriptional regulator [Nanoarchaeota archaeon]